MDIKAMDKAYVANTYNRFPLQLVSGKGSVVLGITKDDLRDIMDIRQRIEGLASFYAAKNITQEGIDQLKHLTDLQEFYHSKGDISHQQAVDDEFHVTIYRLSRRNVIIDTLIPLHRKTRLYRKISMEDNERSPKTLQEHLDISQAIINGDAALAKELTKKHIENAKIHMMGCVKING